MYRRLMFKLCQLRKIARSANDKELRYLDKRIGDVLVEFEMSSIGGEEECQMIYHCQISRKSSTK